MRHLSIIIPLLNEARALPLILERMAMLERQGCEIIFADGGSEDGSAELIEDAGFRLVRASRGRARQMNAGAARACGDALLFLHADTLLPESAASLIERALKDGKHGWGRFDVHISKGSSKGSDSIDYCSNKLCFTEKKKSIESDPFEILRVVAALMNLRSRLTGIATGDQGMFMTRAAFDAVGGFPDQPLMEDIEMSKRLKQVSRPACVTQKLVTSGRRWETRGVWRTIFLMWRLRWLYWRGVPPDRLAEMYR